MKKTILIFLFVVVSLCILRAQESNESRSKGGVFIGVKAGYGIVNYNSIAKAETNFADMTYNNLSFGILTGYKFNSFLSLQVEGNFAQYGARDIIPTYIYSPQSPLIADYGSNSTVDRIDMTLYNIDIPLTLKLILREGSVSPYVYGGVNYGINVIGQASIVRKVTFNEAVDYQKSTDDITERVFSNEFAPIAGCGVMLGTFKTSFFGDIRYKYGLTNLSNVDNKLGFTNNTLWISFGVLFNL